MKKVSTKNLSEIIRKNLLEMPMDFETPDRPHEDLQNKMTDDDTPVSKVPLPQTGREPQQNYQELLASERYKQIAQRVRQYTHMRPQETIQGSQASLIPAAKAAVGEIMQIEHAHLEELSELAIKLVKKEMGIPEGSVQWDCKIEISNLEGFNREEEEQPNPPEINTEIEVEIATNLEKLNLERAKRRMINMMIQGAAAKGQYMYHMVEPELQRITGNNRLINLYGILMSILDTQYWQYADETIKGMAGTSASTTTGREEVDRNTEPPTIRARGINFPTLVHEIIKAVMELFSHQGEPEDKEMFQQVMDLEDTLEKEVWDLRLGPPLWERIRNQFPEEVLTDERKYELQNWILVEIFKLPAKEFLTLTKEIVSGSAEGKRLVKEIYDSIVALLNGQPAEEETQVFQQDIEEMAGAQSDEDINSFLDQLTKQGIGRAREEREPEPEAPPVEDMDDTKLSGMGLNALNTEANKAIDGGNWELAQRIQKMIERKQGHPK
jgi:hypothetical protein